jgi:hypothetical protein
MVRTYLFAGLMAAAGALFMLSPKTAYVAKTEDQMEQMLPDVVDGMPFERSYEDPEASYRMDDTTYELLQPFGIVARVYTRGAERFDAVVIASRSKDSFHDPRVCFSAQGWLIEKFTPSSVMTRNRGEVPVTLIVMSSKTVRRQLAAFAYRGPGGFYASTQRLKLAMFFEQIRGGRNIDGVFYRFIPSGFPQDTPEAEKIERLRDFIAKYLDASYESSGGYF